MLLPGVAHAQLDASAMARAQRRGENVSLGGANPFATGEEGTGEPTDSTKIRRIRKPLESYYFNDSIRALPNFMWHIDRDYNTVEVMPIDTTLNLWRLDYPHYHKRLGNNSVGGLGQGAAGIFCVGFQSAVDVIGIQLQIGKQSNILLFR